MGRIIICADSKFPHGDAGANRVLYVAKALKHAGRTVNMVSFGNPSNTETDFVYEGIECHLVPLNAQGYFSKIKKKAIPGLMITSILKKIKVDREDLIYLYGTNSLFIGPIFNYCKKLGCKVFIDVVEWRQPFQYQYKKLDPRYISTNRTFVKIAPKVKNVIAISENLSRHYKSQNCNVEVFPVFIDSEKQTVVIDEDKAGIDLIYPGLPYYKDDIETMLYGLAALDENQLAQVRFHMTGISKEDLSDFLGKKAEVIDRLGDHIIFHGWLEYDELLMLYEKIDFLYMSRPDNIVSRSNFPSKIPELMCWGIATIGNKTGDYYHYLTDGKDSIIFEKNTVEDCKNAIARVIDLPREEIVKMRFAARETVVNKFDYKKWADRVSDFISGEEESTAAGGE